MNGSRIELHQKVQGMLYERLGPPGSVCRCLDAAFVCGAGARQTEPPCEACPRRAFGPQSRFKSRWWFWAAGSALGGLGHPKRTLGYR
jgi:hypothetical protein